MRKFFAAPENVTESEITLYGSDVNHIENVLRMKAGVSVDGNDGYSNRGRESHHTLFFFNVPVGKRNPRGIQAFILLSLIFPQDRKSVV